MYTHQRILLSKFSQNNIDPKQILLFIGEEDPFKD
mgnify:CR=1 FL=1